MRRLFIVVILLAVAAGSWSYLHKMREGANPSPLAAKETPAAKAVGTLARVDGPFAKVVIRGPAGNSEAGEGATLHTGDHLITSSSQSAKIELADGSQIVLGPSSDLAIDEVLGPDGHSGLTLLAGILHALVRKVYAAAAPFTVSSQTSVMGVRGTEFIAKNDVGGLLVATITGTVQLGRTLSDLNNTASSVALTTGTTASLVGGMSMPTPPRGFQLQTLVDSLGKTNPLFVRAVWAPSATPQPRLFAGAPVNGLPAPSAPSAAQPAAQPAATAPSAASQSASSAPSPGPSGQQPPDLTPEEKAAIDNAINKVKEQQEEALKHLAPEVTH